MRTQSVLQFRRDYDCVAMHRRGMARQLLMHASNAGASVYFGDCGLRTRDGYNVRESLLGFDLRVSLFSRDTIQ